MSPNQLATNLRFLLWEQGVPVEQWGETLARWLECTERQATRILNSEDFAQPDMIQRLQIILNLSEETYLQLSEIDLCHKRLGNLREHNIDYLINRIRELGDQKQALADEINVALSTISRWLHNGARPIKKLKPLCEFFGEDIRRIDQVPFFLYPKIGRILNHRRWLYSKIEDMSDKKLESLMPALLKIFDDS